MNKFFIFISVVFFLPQLAQARVFKIDREYGQANQVAVGLELKLEIPDNAIVIPPQPTEAKLLLAQIKFPTPTGDEILFLESLNVSLGKELSRSKILEKHMISLATSLGLVDDLRPPVMMPFNSVAGGGWILSGTNPDKTIRLSIVGILNSASVHCVVGVVRHASTNVSEVGASLSLKVMQELKFGKEYF